MEEYDRSIFHKLGSSSNMGHIGPLPVGIPRVELNNFQKKEADLSEGHIGTYPNLTNRNN